MALNCVYGSHHAAGQSVFRRRCTRWGPHHAHLLLKFRPHTSTTLDVYKLEVELVLEALKPAIILVEPQIGENIGAAARAMKNFGLSDLRLVKPRDGWPNPSADVTASHASDLLRSARLYDSVEDAIADLDRVYAATARTRFMSKAFVTSRQLPADLRQLAASATAAAAAASAAAEAEAAEAAAHAVAGARATAASRTSSVKAVSSAGAGGCASAPLSAPASPSASASLSASASTPPSGDTSAPQSHRQPAAPAPTTAPVHASVQPVGIATASAPAPPSSLNPITTAPAAPRAPQPPNPSDRTSKPGNWLGPGPVPVPEPGLGPGLHGAAVHVPRAGVLFGRESSGLTNEEVALANKVLTIEADPVYPVLNLAQAIVCTVYELHHARLDTAGASVVQKARVGSTGISTAAAPLMPYTGLGEASRADVEGAGNTTNSGGVGGVGGVGGGRPGFPMMYDSGARGLVTSSAEELRQRAASLEPATRGELEGFLGRLISELDGSGFFESAEKRPYTLLSIRNLAAKVEGLSGQEVALLHGMLSKLAGVRAERGGRQGRKGGEGSGR